MYQDASTRIHAEGRIEKRDFARSWCRILAKVSKSSAEFDNAITQQDFALHLHNRNTVPEHVGHFRILDGEFGEAAGNSADPLVNDHLLHFQRGRKAVFSDYPKNAGTRAAADQQVFNFASAVRLIINYADCPLDRHDLRWARPDDCCLPFPTRATAGQRNALGNGERFVVNARCD
jgi:hypothetical protein